MYQYIIARSARKRPTLQHVLSNQDPYVTTCGIQVTGWSRAYQSAPIPQVMCLKCAKEINLEVI